MWEWIGAVWLGIGETLGPWGQVAAVAVSFLMLFMAAGAVVYVFASIALGVLWFVEKIFNLIDALFVSPFEALVDWLDQAIVRLFQRIGALLWWVLLLPVRVFRRAIGKPAQSRESDEADDAEMRRLYALHHDRFESFEEFVLEYWLWKRTGRGFEWDEEPEPRRERQEDGYGQALKILGLEDGAFTLDDLKRRHRELMKRVHPDLGGSDVFAQQLNQAAEAVKRHCGWN